MPATFPPESIYKKVQQELTGYAKRNSEEQAEQITPESLAHQFKSISNNLQSLLEKAKSVQGNNSNTFIELAPNVIALFGNVDIQALQDQKLTAQQKIELEQNLRYLNNFLEVAVYDETPSDYKFAGINNLLGAIKSQVDLQQAQATRHQPPSTKISNGTNSTLLPKFLISVLFGSIFFPILAACGQEPTPPKPEPTPAPFFTERSSDMPNFEGDLPTAPEEQETSLDLKDSGAKQIFILKGNFIFNDETIPSGTRFSIKANYDDNGELVWYIYFESNPVKGNKIELDTLEQLGTQVIIDREQNIWSERLEIGDSIITSKPLLVYQTSAQMDNPETLPVGTTITINKASEGWSVAVSWTSEGTTRSGFVDKFRLRENTDLFTNQQTLDLMLANPDSAVAIVQSPIGIIRENLELVGLDNNQLIGGVIARNDRGEILTTKIAGVEYLLLFVPRELTAGRNQPGVRGIGTETVYVPILPGLNIMSLDPKTLRINPDDNLGLELNSTISYNELLRRVLETSPRLELSLKPGAIAREYVGHNSPNIFAPNYAPEQGWSINYEYRTYGDEPWVKIKLDGTGKVGYVNLDDIIPNPDSAGYIRLLEPINILAIRTNPNDDYDNKVTTGNTIQNFSVMGRDSILTETGEVANAIVIWNHDNNQIIFAILTPDLMKALGIDIESSPEQIFSVGTIINIPKGSTVMYDSVTTGEEIEETAPFSMGGITPRFLIERIVDENRGVFEGQLIDNRSGKILAEDVTMVKVEIA